MIKEEKHSYVDFVKYINFPNPINFYFEKRFSQFSKFNAILETAESVGRLNQNLNSLVKLMFLYRIQIIKQADIHIIEKLR